MFLALALSIAGALACHGKDVKYDFNIEAYNRKLERKWMKLAAESSKKEKEAK